MGSAQHPLHVLELVYDMPATCMSRYWSVDPAPLRLTLGGYPRMDDGHPPVGLSDSSWSFAFWTGVAQAKFWILSRLLRLMGQSHFANKLWNGWQVRQWPSPVFLGRGLCVQAHCALAHAQPSL